MKCIVLVLFALISMLLVSGCTGNRDQTPKERAQQRCIEECQLEVSKGTYLEDGPCISDINPRWNVGDWVCDVAHDPRQDIDNVPKNQCAEFREGEASHFVEVTPDCQLIRAV